MGVVLRLDDLVAKNKAAAEVFDHFLAHPYVAPLLDGGELSEYGCHLVAEGGLAMLGDIVFDGLVIVGEAAGMTLNTGLTVRGMDLAAGSAIAAAAAIDSALKSGDTSQAGLDGYRTALFDSFVGKDLTTYAKAPHFLENPRMYVEYGELLANVLYAAFNHDLTPRKHLAKAATDALRTSPVKLTTVVRDAFAGVRAL